jgi:hypothetical protein
MKGGLVTARKIEEKQRSERFSARQMDSPIREGRMIDLHLVVSLFYQTIESEVVIRNEVHGVLQNGTTAD